MNTLSSSGPPMTGNGDPTWDHLAETWQRSDGALDNPAAAKRAGTNHRPSSVPAPDLARRVRRQSFLLWLVGAAELSVCVLTVLLAADFAFGPRRSEPSSLPTAAGLLLLVFIAGRQAWSTRRGLWTDSSARDHADYLRLLRRRLEAREQGLAFSARLTLALFLAFSVWLPLTREGGLLGSFAFLVIWCGGAAGWIMWLGRRARREHEGIAALEGALHGDVLPER